MTPRTLEKKIIEGNGLNTQEIKKLREVFNKYAYKTKTRLITLTLKGKPIKSTWIIQNGASEYKVKSDCIKEGIYKIPIKEIREKFISAIKKDIPGCVGLRGKIKGYQIKELIFSKKNYKNF